MAASSASSRVGAVTMRSPLRYQASASATLPARSCSRGGALGRVALADVLVEYVDGAAVAVDERFEPATGFDGVQLVVVADDDGAQARRGERHAYVQPAEDGSREANGRHPIVRRPLARRAHRLVRAARRRGARVPERRRPADAAQQLPSAGVGAGEAELGMSGFRFHDLRHTAATLAAASGASLKALMARIGHASAAAALRYQHVIDGQDADIVRYLERFGEEPPVPSRATTTRQRPSVVGTQWARRAIRRRSQTNRNAVTSNFAVETMGLEPTTPCLQSRCSRQLSYVPG